MKITKYAHSCLLIEKDGVRMLIDPGSWNKIPDAEHVDAILITHEHQDHFDIQQVKTLLVKNPDAKVITHEAVGKKLSDSGIMYEIIEPGATINIRGVSIESHGTEHAPVYGDISPCRNTGYLIAEELFIPGDALREVPEKSVRILALPCGGPWMKLSEAIDYAKAIKPKTVFPIHDAMYTEAYRNSLIPRVVGGNLESEGMVFIDMPPDTSREF